VLDAIVDDYWLVLVSVDVLALPLIGPSSASFVLDRHFPPDNHRSAIPHSPVLLTVVGPSSSCVFFDSKMSDMLSQNDDRSFCRVYMRCILDAHLHVICRA
jgi:hypothetical protein